jgi:effector-binding domain-containing protein
MMNYEIEVRQLDSQPTVSIREQVARDQIEELLAERVTEIEAFIAGRRGQSSGNPFARLHNYGEVERVDVDLEVGVPVVEAVDCSAETAFNADSLPGGPAAVLRYGGPYEQISEAYEQLRDWVRESEYEAQGAPWEFYVGDLESDDWEVEIVWPLMER